MMGATQITKAWDNSNMVVKVLSQQAISTKMVLLVMVTLPLKPETEHRAGAISVNIVPAIHT